MWTIIYSHFMYRLQWANAIFSSSVFLILQACTSQSFMFYLLSLGCGLASTYTALVWGRCAVNTDICTFDVAVVQRAAAVKAVTIVIMHDSILGGHSVTCIVAGIGGEKCKGDTLTADLSYMQRTISHAILVHMGRFQVWVNSK